MKNIRSLCLFMAISTLALSVFAQTVIENVAPVPADDGSSMTTLISIAIALVSGLIAIWQNKQASTARKITASIVLGVEQATKLPQVAAAEKQIKATIRQHAQDAGIQPLLDRLVQNLT